jgi:hypothetical protein
MIRNSSSTPGIIILNNTTVQESALNGWRIIPICGMGNVARTVVRISKENILISKNVIHLTVLLHDI